MRDGQASIDVVVRNNEGLSLSAVATEIHDSGLQLVGTLIDPTVVPHVDVEISVAFAPEFVSGAHIERTTDFTIALGDQDIAMHWQVETHELGGGFALHDAFVSGDEGEFRAFLIEDLIATIGIGGAAVVTGIAIWRSVRREKAIREATDRRWQQCIERGGSPKVIYRNRDGVSIDPGGKPRIASDYNTTVECDMSQARQNR